MAARKKRTTRRFAPQSPVAPSSVESSERAGRYVGQPTGYRAFLPNPLPPEPPIQVTAAFQFLLSEADRQVGRLDATTGLLPNPDLFVAMYVRKEAVISSQIEGTQASLADLLEYEAVSGRRRTEGDVGAVVNYVAAMNHGLARLNELPLSGRLLREIHSRLLKNVRGARKDPGQFRRIQNWVGPEGGTIADAIYVPPPPRQVPPAIAELERFLNDETTLIPPLIKCGLAHSQFETIHPFLDGNGRLGRLLITFMLCQAGVLQRPLLYLSAFFKRRRSEYYERLQAVRDSGQWEQWLEFFLRGVRDVSIEAIDTARAIQLLRERDRQVVGQVSGSVTGHVLLDALFLKPVLDVHDVAKVIDRTYPVANGLVAAFEKLGILEETTGGRRNRLFRYKPYLELFGE